MPLKSRFQTALRQVDTGWLVALLSPIIGIVSILNNDRVIQTADGLFHVHRILAMSTLMQQGDLYPRWIPWFHLGYGYPVLNYYAPLATWLGGLLGVAGVSAPNAAALLIALTWVSGSLGMYALVRHCVNAQAGVLAALLWSYAPVGLQVVWNQGSLSQIAASGLIAWLLFTLLRVIERPSLRRAAALGLAAGLSFLAHQPTTFLLLLFLAPGVPLVCLWFGWRQGQGLRRFVFAVGGLTLGVGIAMIFLLPMALEVSYIQVAQPAADIPETLARYFLRADQLFIQPQAPDLSDLNRRLPETFGLVPGVLALVGLLGLLRRRQYGLALACVAGACAVLFLILPISLPVWLSVPLMAQLRFPGRALHLGVVFLAVLGGACVMLLPERWRNGATVVLVVVILAAALPTVYPSRPLLDFSNLTPTDEIQYEADTRSFGGTSYDEFKPRWGERTPKDVPGLDEYLSDPLRLRIIDPQQAGTSVSQDARDRAQVFTEQPVNVSFRQFYFPGWSAFVDDVPVTPFPEERFGLLTLPVPAGTHTVRIQWDGTLIEKIAPLLTLVSLGIMVWLWRKKEAVEPQAESPLPRPAGRRLLGGLGVFALLNVVYILPHTGWFRQQSPLDSPAYMQTAVHQRFGEAYELLGYSAHGDSVQPGDGLDVTLYWRALAPLQQIYQPVLQLVNPGVYAAWATSNKFFVGDFQTLHTPDYFVSDEHRLQVDPNTPPYVGRLLVKLIDPETGTALTLADGKDYLLLDTPIRVQGSGTPAQKVMNTVIDGKVELWCSSVQQQGDQLTVDLYWHVLQPLAAPDISLFIHGFDAQDAPVLLYDSLPLNGDYPPNEWLPGQNLSDHVVVLVAPGLTRLTAGMHLADGNRLSVTQEGVAAPDNLITLPIEERDC